MGSKPSSQAAKVKVQAVASFVQEDYVRIITHYKEAAKQPQKDDRKTKARDIETNNDDAYVEEYTESKEANEYYDETLNYAENDDEIETNMESNEFENGNTINDFGSEDKTDEIYYDNQYVEETHAEMYIQEETENYEENGSEMEANMANNEFENGDLINYPDIEYEIDMNSEYNQQLYEIKRLKLHENAVENMNSLRENKDNRNYNGSLTEEQIQSISTILKSFYKIKNEPADVSRKARVEIAEASIENKTTDIICQYCKELFEKDINENFSTLRLLTKYLLNASDASPEIGKLIMKQRTFMLALNKRVTKWERPCLQNELEEKEQTLLKTCLGIYHNLSMDEDLAPKLRQDELFTVLKPYLRAGDVTIRLHIIAVLAGIVNENESELLSTEPEIINFIIQQFRSAVSNESRRSDEGKWSVRELASLIRKMARNDKNKISLENGGVVPILVILAENEDTEEKREAVGALLSLSFNKDIAETMINSDDVIDTLVNIRDLEDDFEINDMANRALWTMREQLAASHNEKYKEIGNQYIDTQDENSKRNKGGHIMISYNRCHRSIAVQISEELKRNNYSVWIDLDNINENADESTTDAMASAVENADIVLICFSPQYKNSSNCRSEAEYSDVRKKRILYLKMESGYEADGWLGLQILKKYFYDFGGKYPFRKKMDELLKAIQKEYKSMGK